MIYRSYGSTGINVSAIGFGGMRFRDQNDVDGCAGLVKAAYDKDINYFDTAIGYGKSEELFGAAFKEMQKTRAAKPFYVATKTMAGDPKGVRSEVETSLKRMDLDHIDFYHVWCVMSLNAFGDRKANGVLKEFERLKSEGLVKHICVSTHMSGEDIGTVLADYPFEGVLLGYSAMNFAYRDAGLDAAARLKRGVVVMNPLGGGVIPQHPERFSFVRTRDDETVVEGALRFLLNDTRVTVALVGLSDEKQLAEAVSAATGFKPVAAEKVDHIRASLKQAYNELCTGCGYCDECPQEVPVPRMMDAYNHYLLSGKPADMINRLAWHWWTKPGDPVFDACVECGRCEKLCTQKLPIMQRLKEIKAEAEKVKEEKK
jgi:uncharacterized protein